MSSSRNLLGSFQEIRSLLGNLPCADDAARSAARSRERQLTKSSGTLGRLEEVAEWLSAWQGRHPPSVEHPRVAIFAGNHGVARFGVSAYPPSVTAERVRNIVSGGAPVNQICRIMDADLRIYEMALDQPSADFTEGEALGQAACVRAAAYGMMAVEPSIDLLCIGDLGVGNTTAASAVACALFGGDVTEWVASGTGLGEAQLARKRSVVSDGLARHRELLSDPLNTLAALGGHEMAAIAGAVLAARLARIPVLLDGFTTTVAASVLEAMQPGTLDHCNIAHLSVEPGHSRICSRLGKKPLLDLSMCFGEGTGAALAIGLVRSAAGCHGDLAASTAAEDFPDRESAH